MKKPLVSVILTTKNEEKNIDRCLASIQNQTYKFTETILVDNNSKDRTLSLASKFTRKVYSYGPERSAQRNYGAHHSKGTFLVFIDADMELNNNVIEACVNIAQKTDTIGGVIIPEVSIANTFWEKVKAFERSFYNAKGDESTDAARFFSRKAFEEVGGYDETITGPEDWDLSETIQKKGYRIARVMPQIYHYENIPSLYSIIKKKYYYGIKAHRYLSKHTVSPLSGKTIYVLRPVFYSQWTRFLRHPILGIALVIMLTGETVGGGIGYLLGMIKKQ